ncbi:MAG TPA: hypothetical protein VGB65_11750 [Allosphingosinicella sp.]|jgi:hypothetical protein
MKPLIRAAAFAFALAAAFPALAGSSPKTLVVREGLTAEQLDVDGKICLKEAKAAEKGKPIAPMPRAPGVAGAAASGIVAGAFKGWTGMKAFLAAHDACLDRLGYRQIELTPEQRKEYGALKTSEQRTAYIIEFSRRATEGR